MWSSIFLLGTMRPTKRMLINPSRRMGSRAGREGASVIRAVLTAMGITPVRVKPSASSSWRLKSESPSARSTRFASVPSSRRPSAARRNSPASYGAKNAAGVMLWYCSTRAPFRFANASVIADGSAKWKMVTSPCVAAASVEGSTSPRRSSSIVIAKSSESCPMARSIPRTVRALSPIASPRCAAGTHWWIFTSEVRDPRSTPGRHRGATREFRIYVRRSSDVGRRTSVVRRGERSIRRRPELAQLLQACGLIEHSPEVEWHLGRGARRRSADLIDEAEQRAAEILAEKARERGVLRRDDGLFHVAVVQHRVHQARHVEGVLRLVEHAAAIHGGRHRGCRISEHGDLLVEALDDRNAEAFVLAGAQEQIRHVVERGQFLVRHVTEEMDVGRAEPRDQPVQHREVLLEAAV